MGSQSRIISLDDTSRSARYHRVASSSHNFKDSARQGRRPSAYYDVDDDDVYDNEREEEDTSSLNARITRARRSYTKKKADRRYERQYGSYESSARSSSADSGPRAALYETKMGSSHRKAARMQGSRSQGFSSRGTARAAARRATMRSSYKDQPRGTSGGGRLNALAALFFGTPGSSSDRTSTRASRKAADRVSTKASSKASSRFPFKASSKKSTKASSKGSTRAHHLSARVLVPCVTAALIVLGCAFLYAPTRQYYQEVRERDRLEAEYEAVQARNVEIQDQIDALSTDEGVEDRAREEFGWVLQGENAGVVSGIDVEEDEAALLAGNVSSDSIKAPETWYSIILDPIFGVE